MATSGGMKRRGFLARAAAVAALAVLPAVEAIGGRRILENAVEPPEPAELIDDLYTGLQVLITGPGDAPPQIRTITGYRRGPDRELEGVPGTFSEFVLEMEPSTDDAPIPKGAAVYILRGEEPRQIPQSLVSPLRVVSDEVTG